MKYEAVIFNLFGTSVPNMTLSEHRDILKRIAHALSTTSDNFAQLWFDTFNERCTGVFQIPDDNVGYMCRTIGMPVDKTEVKRAARIRFNYSVQSMVPRSNAIETLSHPKSAGCKIGLISDFSAEVLAIWKDFPFVKPIDLAIFSRSLGAKKPDPRIYRLATNQLGVEPETCLYVGDGSSRELSGATQVGIHPILLNSPEGNPDAYQIDREDWDGSVISSLTEVLDLVGIND